MKKEKKVFLACVFLLLLTALTIYVISGTYAKYVSSFEGTSTARAAKWAWKINEQDLAAGTTTMELNLFDTIQNTDGESEINVTKDTKDKLIAPGTQGRFTIKVQNMSEVKATYAYSLSQTNPSNIPIEYSRDQKTWTTDISSFVTKPTELGIKSEATDATIYWRWAFERKQSSGEADQADTTIGFNGNARVTVTATLNLQQVD